MTYTIASPAGPAGVMPYYRMAEAYLIYAEAENELNGMTQAAVDKVNAVRGRVNVGLYSAGQFSKEEFRDHILDEWLWEFTLEGKDYFDLVRMGQLEERCYGRSEEHTSELQSLMRISYAVFCLKKKKK